MERKISREQYEVELSKLTNNELKEICKKRNIPHSAPNKTTFIQRILKDANLSRANEIGKEIDMKESLNAQELIEYGAMLGPVREAWDFEIAMPLANLISRVTVEDAITSDEALNLISQFEEFRHEWNQKCPVKTDILHLTSEVEEELRRLVAKGAVKWDEADRQIILNLLGRVRIAIPQGGSMIETYFNFLDQLHIRYSMDLKLKYLLDPYLVVVDLPEMNAVTINAAITSLVGNPNPSSAVLPGKDNASDNPFAWSFATFDQANWFMGYLKGRIPTIQLLFYRTDGPGLQYN